MKYLKLTQWEQSFTRVGPGQLTISKWRYLPKPKEWLKMVIYHLLSIVVSIIFLATLGLVTSEMASMWLFSDWLDD